MLRVPSRALVHGRVGSARGKGGKEIKWGGYLAGRKNGTRTRREEDEEKEEEEERAVTDSKERERHSRSFYVFIVTVQVAQT